MKKEKYWRFKYHLLASIIITSISVLSDIVTSGGALPYLMGFSNLLDGKSASAIGIIGGADGPTTIFLSGNPYFLFFISKLLFFSVLLVLYLPSKKFLNKKI
jgi:Na+-transporting methylmalonyl-CoA/oxaloacetate decarboxylase beta subunit